MNVHISKENFIDFNGFLSSMLFVCQALLLFFFIHISSACSQVYKHQTYFSFYFFFYHQILFFVASALLEENEQHEKQWKKMKNEMAHLYLMELYKNNFWDIRGTQ